MARVQIEYRDHIAWVTMTRPDKMNALDPEMVEGLLSAGREVKQSDARVVVLSGEGQSFCSGLDIMSFMASGKLMNAQAWLMERAHGDVGEVQTNDMQELAMMWRRLEIPVIAALQGAVYGGGLQIALGADIRIASKDARFAIMEMKWGIVPDMGGMVLLPQLVRSDVLRKLTYTASPIDADQAERWGLVTELADDAKVAAAELAEQIAEKSPNAIRAAKRLISYAESGAGENDVLLRESAEQIQLIGQPEQMEVVAAQMQSRTTVFK